MNTIIQNIQERLKEIEDLQFVDEDTGQLDYYSPNFPVKWPCVLIDIPSSDFTDIGMDKNANPQNRQMSDEVISLKVANLKMSNTSGMAPQGQKDNAWSIWELLESIHQKVQGFEPEEKAGKLIRRVRRRTKRDDGVQEYIVVYEFGQSNV